MGIRYYGWPLRTQADFERAVDDPCATSYVLDRREATINEENCVGLDKGFRVLLDYFLQDWMPEPSTESLLEGDGPPNTTELSTLAAADRCHCIDDRQINVLPRAGALLLLGDVLYSDGYATWKPYYGIVPRSTCGSPPMTMRELTSRNSRKPVVRQTGRTAAVCSGRSGKRSNGSPTTVPASFTRSASNGRPVTGCGLQVSEHPVFVLTDQHHAVDDKLCRLAVSIQAPVGGVAAVAIANRTRSRGRYR